MSQGMDQELRNAFFVEAADIVENLEDALAQVGAGTKDAEIINTIFRALHTIKGNSSFLDLHQITNLTHKAETILDQVRNGKRALDSVVAALIAQVAEDLRAFIVDQNLSHDARATEAQLLALLDGKTVQPLAPKIIAPVSQGATVPVKSSLGSVIRIDERRFNRIVNLVSELNLYRNALELLPEKLESLGEPAEDLRLELDLAVSKMAHATRELSSLVLGAKLVPMNQVFRRFPKVVQDLGQKLGKEIQLKVRNGDAELDKSIVDAIADPMTHLIRNSADHGIETKEERVRRGKPIAGTITLNSHVRGNFVYVEIHDDGRGIDPEKIVAKAIEKGILPKEKSYAMSESQKLSLIFAPGFSTAEAVTDISGRGVGMDVVKSNINKLKGSVLIQSRVGQGTTIQLRFPMSMVVLLSLFVDINGSACAISLDQVEESSDYRRQELLTELPQREPSKYIKLYALSELLWNKPLANDLTSYHVLRFKESESIGFIVEDFLSIEEAVVQSVDSYIAALPGVQGATLRKDGTVSLVLNIQDILTLAQKQKPLGFARRREKSTATGQALPADYLSLAGNS